MTDEELVKRIYAVMEESKWEGTDAQYLSITRALALLKKRDEERDKMREVKP